VGGKKNLNQWEGGREREGRRGEGSMGGRDERERGGEGGRGRGRGSEGYSGNSPRREGGALKTKYQGETKDERL
jgi:hypothetical protein